MQARSNEALIAVCQKQMAVGSLSFSLAAKLLGEKERADILMLYSWCRFCDDAIDSLPIGASTEEKKAVIASLRSDTADALKGSPKEHPVFEALCFLNQRSKIPSAYFDELLLGMEMDAIGYVYQNLADLELYAYRVAGVVGLMYCHIVGVSDLAALPRAVDLGIAMQLTNIARDVLSDRQMGRDYIPKSWVLELGEVRAFQKLLETADSYYASGDQGMKYLPFFAACAAQAARNVYSAISDQIISHGGVPQPRVIITKGHKLILAVKGVLQIVAQLPKRLRHPWSRVLILDVWRLPQCHP